MSDKKPNSPQAVALLGVGTAAAVGVAVWSISGALAPRHAASTIPRVPATPPTTDGSITREAAIPGVLPGSVADRASHIVATPDATASTDSEPRSAVPLEAALAPEADPFTPLPTRAIAPDTAQSGSGSVSQLKGDGRTREPAAPGQPRTPNMNPMLDGPMSPNRRGLPPMQMPGPPVPELVGTLLGDRPSAVFRGASALKAVPVGGSFGDWKVAFVSHGYVVVKGMGRVVPLGIGSYVPSPAMDRVATPRGSFERALPIRKLEGFASRESAFENAAVKLLTPSNSASESVVTTSSNVATGDNSITSAADTTPQNDPLPALPDNALTSEGRLAQPPLDSAPPRDSSSVAESETVPSVQPAVTHGLKPFRALVAWNGESGAAPSLPARSMVVASAAAPRAARAQSEHGRRHHRLHHRNHHHRRYSHRRPMHQQRQVA